ncbi:MAG: TIM barrel protein [Lachnospiraceae bacterium]|nr:TIM barrel protein [Lachnospiraceae bacterium]
MKKLDFSQFGIMSVQYQQYSLEYCMDSIASNGFQYIDFWGGASHYCVFDTPVSKRQAKVSKIRQMMEERGLKMSVFTAEQICLYPINVASSNPYVRKNSIDIVKSYLEDTKEFGANYYFMQMGYSMFDEDYDSAWKRSVEALQELTEYAEKIGVKTVMEQLQPYESNLCYSTKTLKGLIDAVNSPYLTACIDCVAAAAAGETVEEYYEAFHGRINHAHLADGNPTGHRVPGEGSNPLTDYLTTFAEHDFNGSITVEINNQMYFDNPDAAVAKAAKWLKECSVVSC